MKILYVTAFPPNNRTAGQNFSLNVLRKLQSRADIYLYCFSYSDHDVDENLKRILVKEIKLTRFLKVLNSLKMFFFHPFFSSRFSFSLACFIFLNSRKFDVVYLDFSQVFCYCIFCRSEKVVMMAHDVIAQKFSRKRTIARNLNLFILRMTEGFLLRKAKYLFCFSNKDKDIIYKNYRLNAQVVPFFLDERVSNVYLEDYGCTGEFVFFGAWNRNENLEGLFWFMENVHPFLNTENRILVIGGGMSKDNIKKICANKNVKYAGFVENPYIYLARSRALIAPLFNGAGVKVKVVEALATGTPVIGSDIAFEGIEFEDREFLKLCHSSDDYITTINTFTVPSPSKRKMLSADFIDQYNYNNSSIVDVLNNLH